MNNHERDKDNGVPRETRVVASASDDKNSASDIDYIFRLYLNDVGEVPLLSTKETVELTARVRQGDRKARETMIRANLRLVVKIANDYDGLGLPLLDVIQEGNNGLMKAVERFDPDKGSKFSTYASLWIKQSIKRALANTSKTIRKPIHIVEKLSKLRRIEGELQKAFERPPTDIELSEAVGFSIEKINKLRSFAIQMTSLDAPVSHETDAMLRGETVADNASLDPASLLESGNLKQILAELVSDLPERESEILQYRFGLGGSPTYTLEEVGSIMGITRERVRQIQNATLEKLRHLIERMETVQQEIC